ncbi:outer membrane protein transport protein [Marinilabiliaceae bacterium ANBcel2]|nr:outer membrane protein transport protein [Marinilabiliaceae bacterium ANBcel2]
MKRAMRIVRSTKSKPSHTRESKIGVANDYDGELHVTFEQTNYRHMKRAFIKTVLTTILVAGSSISIAQNMADALRYSQHRPSGTARDLSLSSATGALGGDFSFITTNPAGIAVYRSSEFTFTPALNYTKTDSYYNNLHSDDDKYSFPFQQIAFVGSYAPQHEVSSGLISTHFGIGYSRTNSFNRNSFIRGSEIYSSLLDQFVWNANEGKWNDFYNDLAYRTFLVDEDPDFPGNYMHAFEYVDYDEPDPLWGASDGVDQSRYIKERGRSGEYNFSFGANFSHMLYIGGSLGIHSFSYDKTSTHYETVSGGIENYFPEYYDFRYSEGWNGLEKYYFEEEIDVQGTGVDVKVGVIYKPTNQLRLGAAIHTPIFYTFDEEYSTDIYAEFFEITEHNLISGIETYPDDKEYGEFSYKFRTPMKFTGSAAYTFSNLGFISVDYEYVDYSTMTFKSKGSGIDNIHSFTELNDNIKDTFVGTHNIRVGGEYIVSNQVALRAGYGWFGSPYNSNHFKSDDKHYTISGGLGYRIDNMTIDFAYMLRNQENYISLYDAGHVHVDDKPLANIETKNHQVAITLGWRF